MSETPNPATADALQAEVDRLRTKNGELLVELKAAKAAATDAQAALDAAQGERDAAVADARFLRLDAPVAALLGDVAVDADLFGQLFARHYRFALDDAGAVVILNAEGEPATVTEPGEVTYQKDHRGRPTATVVSRKPDKVRPATFTAGDVRKLAEASGDADKFARLLPVHASGGGASGSQAWPPSPTGDNAPAPAQAAPSPYGLR